MKTTKLWMMWDGFNIKNKPRIFSDKAALDAALKTMYDNYVPKLQMEKVSYKQFLKDLRNAGLKTESVEVE